MAAHAHHATLELRLRSVDQLFNSMDPSPFLEKDLDPDAEQFIREWASEPHHGPRDLRILLHLEEPPAGGDAKTLVTEAIHHFFAYQARIERGIFRRLMRDGQVSLAIGVLFITVCLSAASVIPGREGDHFLRALSESLLVAGWVGMWRPIEIFLYDWWPVRRRVRVFDRLAHSAVDVRLKARPHHPA
jgi:hypothetical protein